MRIVQLANGPVQESGAVRIMLQALSAGYAAAGHERILVLPGARAEREADAAGEVIRLAPPAVPCPWRAGHRLLPNSRRILCLLEDLQPDAVEVFDRTTLLPVGPWARVEGIPALAVALRRADVVLPGRLRAAVPTHRLAAANARGIAASFDTIVCPSSWAQSEFTRLGLLGTVRVPFGVDLGTFAPDQRRPDVRKRLLHGADIALIHVGRLAREKRPSLLLACLAELRRRGLSAHLTVVGDGPMRRRMEAAAAGLPVSFAGHVADRAELARLLASSDLALFPEPAQSLGLSALEALACGAPVVASCIGAVGELLDGHASGEVAFSHGRSMAAAVRRLLAVDEATRRSAARRAATRRPWSATVQRMVDLHTGAMSRQRTGC